MARKHVPGAAPLSNAQYGALLDSLGVVDSETQFCDVTQILDGASKERLMDAIPALEEDARPARKEGKARRASSPSP